MKDKKELILNTLIEHKGLAYMIDLAEQIFHNPLFVYDMSGKILAKSSSEISSQVWDILLYNDCLKAEFLQITEQAGVIKQIVIQDEPVLAKFSYSPYRFMGCRIRDKNGAVGIVTLVEVNSFKDEDSSLIVTLCKMILFELLYRERTAMQITPYYGFLTDIIEGKVQELAIRERCKILKLKLPKRMALIGISFTSTHENSLSLYFFRENIMSLLPDCLCIIYDSGLLVIVDALYLKETIFNRIQSSFTNYEIKIRISRTFTDIRSLKNAFIEIKAIDSVCEKLSIDKTLTYYKEIQLYHFMELVSRENDLNQFCDPVLTVLEEYDKTNNANLYRSVEAYLEAGRSIQKAADKMSLHQNTLYYRLKKAEEVSGIDLSDENKCFNLQFSMRMKRMIISI